MSYTPTNWQTGDTITAEKLNNMESGITQNDGYWIPLTNDNDTWVVPSDKRTEVYQVITASKTNIKGFSFYSVGGIESYRLSATVETQINPNSIVRYITSTFFSGGVSPFNYNGTIRLISFGDEWYKAVIIANIFTISLTPTNADFSGTIDRTQAEIDEAYYNEQEVHFLLYSNEYTATETNNYSGEVSFCATMPFYDDTVTNSWLLIRAHTNSDGTYSVDVFPLTPMT